MDELHHAAHLVRAHGCGCVETRDLCDSLNRRAARHRLAPQQCFRLRILRSTESVLGRAQTHKHARHGPETVAAHTTHRLNTHTHTHCVSDSPSLSGDSHSHRRYSPNHRLRFNARCTLAALFAAAKTCSPSVTVTGYHHISLHLICIPHIPLYPAISRTGYSKKSMPGEGWGLGAGAGDARCQMCGRAVGCVGRCGTVRDSGTTPASGGERRRVGLRGVRVGGPSVLNF